MPRMARAVVPGAAHHVTQRGVNRQNVFASEMDREVYLRLAAASFDTHAVRVLGYCLMSNHVHWIVVPPMALALARAFGALHGRYAQHWNAVSVRSGHLWQNRFFSCALDEAHTWAAVRYAERNPVRAGMVSNVEDWPWSSARTRLTGAVGLVHLDVETWRERFSNEQWRGLLTAEDLSGAEEALRTNTYTGRPIGDDAFVQRAERELGRKLQASKGGRPRTNGADPEQGILF